ncbi:MAG: RrF2 family transcriptional regulator [Candidatus Brocadiales bacterium]
MKLLTKNSDYAIRALIVLARNKTTFLSARKIAKQQDIPYQFLRSILQELIRNNLVVSREGGSGGFRINANPEDISIVDVIKIFRGNLQLTECMFRKKICTSYSSCVLRKEIKRVKKLVEKEFSEITLARLLKKQK